MERQLKVFFAGRTNTFSRYAPPFWRDQLVWKLNQTMSRHTVVDTCLLEQRNKLLFEQNIPIASLFGQSCFYIQHSDVLVVNLTDDISVGGSQEMLIAKQFNIPVIGIAPRGGKFNKLRFELGGKIYWNWTHPFVAGLCDIVVNDYDELAATLDEFENIPNGGLAAVDEAVNYYLHSASALDSTINDILSFRFERNRNSKQSLRIYFAGKMNKASGFDTKHWRNELSAIITKNSRFKSVNLDFLETSHASISENDPKMMFGRDCYLIRASDLVIVNLSDDISVGGCAEMLIAKLYQRPLIGVARPNGKFVSPDKDWLGRTVTSYVNPFVSATCDWLIHDPLQLPSVVNELFYSPVKTSQIVHDSAEWYKNNLLRQDKVAQLTFALG
jgi:hypothetical protein